MTHSQIVFSLGAGIFSTALAFGATLFVLTRGKQ